MNRRILCRLQIDMNCGIFVSYYILFGFHTTAMMWCCCIHKSEVNSDIFYSSYKLNNDGIKSTRHFCWCIYTYRCLLILIDFNANRLNVRLKDFFLLLFIYLMNKSSMMMLLMSTMAFEYIYTLKMSRNYHFIMRTSV